MALSWCIDNRWTDYSIYLMHHFLRSIHHHIIILIMTAVRYERNNHIRRPQHSEMAPQNYCSSPLAAAAVPASHWQYWRSLFFLFPPSRPSVMLCWEKERGGGWVPDWVPDWTLVMHIINLSTVYSWLRVFQYQPDVLIWWCDHTHTWMPPHSVFIDSSCSRLAFWLQLITHPLTESIAACNE